MADHLNLSKGLIAKATPMPFVVSGIASKRMPRDIMNDVQQAKSRAPLRFQQAFESASVKLQKLRFPQIKGAGERLH